MMKILLKNEQKKLMNTIRTLPRKTVIATGFGFLVIAAILYFFSKLIWAESSLMTEAALHSLLAYSFLMLIGFIVLVGVPQTFKNLYDSIDLEILFTMPIPTRNIFWMKYIQGFVGVPLFIFVVYIVPLLVYGIATKANILYFPVVIIVLLAMGIIGLSIAYLINLIVVQIIPASRANELMTTMSILSGVFVYLLFMLPQIVSDQSIFDLILSGLPILPKWVPITWGSTAILAAQQGSMSFFIPFVLIMLLTIVIFMFATSLVEKGFRTGWIRLSEGSSKKKRKRRRSGTVRLSHPIIAIGKKEWVTIKRDAREWIVFMPFLFLIVFGLIGFFTGGGELASVRGYAHISWPIAQGLLLFIYTMSVPMVAASSIGREGPSLWVMQVLPLPGRHVVLGKLWLSWLIPFAIVTSIETIAGIFLGWAIWQFVIGLLLKAIITMGMSAIGLWLGTIGGRYNPMNPQARLTLPVTFLMFIVSIIHLVITAIPYAFLFIPMDEIELPQGLAHGQTGIVGILATIWLHFLSWRQNFPIMSFSVGFIVLSLISLAITYLFIRLSAHNIDKGLKIDVVSETSSKPLFGKNKAGDSLY